MWYGNPGCLEICCEDEEPEPCLLILVTITRCGSAVVTADVLVEILLSGVVISSGITDAAGQVSLPFYSDGTYQVRASKTHYLTTTSVPRPLFCDNSNGISDEHSMEIQEIPGGEWEACGCTNYLSTTPCSGTSGRPDAELLPTTLFMTGPDGPLTLVYGGAGTWSTCTMVTSGGCTRPVDYRFECDGTDFRMTRQVFLTCGQAVGKDCTTVNIYTGGTSSVGPPTNCSPFAWSAGGYTVSA